MKPINLSIENFLLFIILCVGAFIRFYGLTDFSYSADEVSALVRTDFSSFSDVLRYGVKENDMHPAGIQVFLYAWTTLVGYSEWLVRLPFVIASVCSLFVIYRLGKRWFSVSTGLIAAALLAGLEYFILYGELARPYSFGLLFCLLTANYWGKIVDNRHPANYLWFALSALAAMYTHYYAFLFVGIVGLTGFFTIERRRWMAYIITGIFIVLLYLPHYGITAYQLDRGGLGGWLSPPDKFWLFEYFFYLFNESWPLIVALGLFLIVGSVAKITRIHVHTYHVVSVVWFATSFLVGFFYSREVSPILQPSVLLFSAPFLLLILANMMSLGTAERVMVFPPLVVLLLTTASTLFENNYFNKTHMGVVEEISVANLEWDKTYNGDLTATVNVSSKSYMDFYADRGLDVDYRIYTLDSAKHWGELNEIVQNAETEYFSYGWSTRGNPMIVYEMIRQKYPEIVDDRIYENSRVTLFGRNKNFKREPLKEIEIDFDDPEFLAGNQDKIVSDSVNGNAVRLAPEDLYGTEIKFPLRLLALRKNEYIAVEFEFISGNDEPGLFSFELERNGAQLEGSWLSSDLSWFNYKPGQWMTGVFATAYNEHWQESDIVKMFLWNNHGADVLLDNVKIRTYEIND